MAAAVLLERGIRHVQNELNRRSPEVESLIGALEDSRADLVRRIAALILSIDPAIREGVKWNAPSYFTTRHFATFHLRAKAGVQLVLHLDVKGRPGVDLRTMIPDPTQLLQWKGQDRAIASFANPDAFEEQRAALAGILHAWVRHTS